MSQASSSERPWSKTTSSRRTSGDLWSYISEAEFLELDEEQESAHDDGGDDKEEASSDRAPEVHIIHSVGILSAKEDCGDPSPARSSIGKFLSRHSTAIQAWGETLVGELVGESDTAAGLRADLQVRREMGPATSSSPASPSGKPGGRGDFHPTNSAASSLSASPSVKQDTRRLFRPHDVAVSSSSASPFVEPEGREVLHPTGITPSSSSSSRCAMQDSAVPRRRASFLARHSLHLQQWHDVLSDELVGMRADSDAPREGPLRALPVEASARIGELSLPQHDGPEYVLLSAAPTPRSRGASCGDDVEVRARLTSASSLTSDVTETPSGSAGKGVSRKSSLCNKFEKDWVSASLPSPRRVVSFHVPETDAAQLEDCLTDQHGVGRMLDHRMRIEEENRHLRAVIQQYERMYVGE